LLINLTYQRNRSSNQLLSYQLPNFVGFGDIVSNFPATIQNSSFELSSSIDIIKRSQFSWSTSINLTIPRNKLVAFPNIESSAYADRYIIGSSLTTQLLIHSLGVDPISGEYIYADKKGDPVASPDYFNDRTVHIDVAPRYYGGIQQTFSIAGFQLDILFQYVKQTGINYIISNGIGYPGNYFPRSFYNQPLSVLNRWQKPDDAALVAGFSTTQRLSDSWVGLSDYVYGDASYLRLKNASLSWQLPKSWLKSIRFDGARIFIQGQNLLTLTKYKGVDPESQGFISLPPLTTCAAGLNVTF
jgi:hypothetical protein